MDLKKIIAVHSYNRTRHNNETEWNAGNKYESQRNIKKKENNHKWYSKIAFLKNFWNKREYCLQP